MSWSCSVMWNCQLKMTYFSFFSLPNYPPNSPPTQKNYVVVCDQWCLCCFNFTKNSSKLQWCVLHILVDQSSYADRLKNRQPTDMTGNNIFNIFAIFPPKNIIFFKYMHITCKKDSELVCDLFWILMLLFIIKILHSSEKGGLCSTFCSSETLQN